MSMTTSAAGVDPQNGPQPNNAASNPASATPSTAAASAIPFVRAARRASQQDFSAGAALGGNQLGPFDIQTNGFLRYLEVLVTATTSGNSATVAFAGDGPFSALSNITFQDPSSEYIVNPYAGYELAMSNKYHGYYEPPYSDPRLDPNYSVTAGAGGTGGSFSFILRVPLEDRERDAFCAVPNSAANKNYRFQAFTGTSSAVYSTAPTTLPASVNLTCTNFYWTEPPASISGAATVPTPNGNGSVGYLDRETFTALTSQTNPTLIFKNVGRVYKSAVFILRNASGVRDSTDWPNPTAIWINGFPMYYYPTASWLSQMQRVYGYQGGTFDTAGHLDTGVFTWHELMAQSGQVDAWGPADQYLATVASTKLQLVGGWGAGASSLAILQRTIKPVSGAALYS